MKSNNGITRVLIAALAMGGGLGVLFFGHQLQWIRQFDVACVAAANTSQNIFHEYDHDTQALTSRPLVNAPERGRSFQHITITNDPERIFETRPPSALDYAVILESLHNRGYQHIILTTRLSWENDPGLSSEGLDSRLSLFDSAIVSLAVTRGPKEGSMPSMLKHALILRSQVHGNDHLVPLVNRIALPPHVDGKGKNVLAGFHRIESNPPAPNHIAMLARWEDKGMIPSIELLMIMQAHNISPKELVIHCGKHIRLGKNGPVIPIDAYGQTPTPKLTQTIESPTPIHADTLITQKKSDSLQPTIALIHASGNAVNPTNTLQADRLPQTLSLTRTFAFPGNGVTYHQLPLWAKLVILLDAAAIVFWLKGTTRINQHLGFALAVTLTFPLLLALMSINQHWIALSAPLATFLIGWLIPHSNRRATTEMPEYHTTDPKPVIRA